MVPSISKEHNAFEISGVNHTPTLRYVAEDRNARLKDSLVTRKMK